MADVCPKCDEEVKREKDRITCEGGCEQQFHIECVHLQAKEIEIIKNNENIQIICDVCQAFCLKTVNNKFNGVYEYLYKLDKRTSDILKLLAQKNENNSEKSKSAIEIKKKRM